MKKYITNFTQMVFTVFLISFTSLILIAGEFSDPKNRQFDFWIGEWNVVNRFLQEDNSWHIEGQGILKVWPVLDGKAILEFWDGTARNGRVTKGFSMRYYDQQKKKWIVCLNWPQENNGGFFFLQGNFRLNRCEIFNQQQNQDKQIVKNRFTFSDITDSTYRWNDGQSLDSGRTWQTNWIMENHRLAELPKWPETNEKFHSYKDDTFATLDEAKYFHSLAGQWNGTMTDSSANGFKKTNIILNFWKTQNGIAMFYQLKTENGFKENGMLTYRKQNNLWLAMRLDNQPESGIITQFWRADNPEVLFTEYSQLAAKPTSEITRYDMTGKTLLKISRYVKIDASDKTISIQKLELHKQE